jgi:hypothetical protein
VMSFELHVLSIIPANKCISTATETYIDLLLMNNFADFNPMFFYRISGFFVCRFIQF